jgi:hypothetical protein
MKDGGEWGHQEWVRGGDNHAHGSDMDHDRFPFGFGLWCSENKDTLLVVKGVIVLSLLVCDSSTMYLVLVPSCHPHPHQEPSTT